MEIFLQMLLYKLLNCCRQNEPHYVTLLKSDTLTSIEQASPFMHCALTTKVYIEHRYRMVVPEFTTSARVMARGVSKFFGQAGLVKSKSYKPRY